MRVRTHPGEILRLDYLEPLEMSATALAEALDVPANRITEVLRGHRDVTADTALRLSKFFDTTPEFWMNLQTAYDLSKAQAQMVIVERRASVAVSREGRLLKEASTGRVIAAPSSRVAGSRSAKVFKSVAASALTHTGSAKETTSKKVASAAAKILHDPKASKAAKSAAASALTQKVKKK
jgi:antitoxin HigA-1